MTSSDHQRYAAVLDLLQLYFDGLYFSDTARLRSVFHPLAIYATMGDGTLLHRTMPDYFDVVDRRESPAKRGETRRDQVLAVDFVGPAMAVARVNCAIGDKLFTDVLSLLHIDGRWQIMAKIFHHVPTP